MERRTDRQHDRAPRPALRGDRDRALDRRRWPLTTTWPGPLSLAHRADLVRAAASAATARACSISRPSSAAIAPSPTGTARCIARPRRFRSRAASAMASAPAAASAEYSPSEWPATKAACRVRSKPPSRFEHAHHREARRHQRRLRVLGQGELAFRSFEHQPREVLRQRLVDLLEDLARRRKGRGEVAPHADRLRALSGKYECPLHAEPRSPFAGLPALVDAGRVVIAAPRPLSRRRCVLVLRQCSASHILWRFNPCRLGRLDSVGARARILTSHKGPGPLCRCTRTCSSRARTFPAPRSMPSPTLSLSSSPTMAAR